MVDLTGSQLVGTAYCTPILIRLNDRAIGTTEKGPYQ